MFIGNEICCAAYGFLNTVQDREINYKLYEAASSVPFGIKHQRESDYSRLLTTYCDPNIGIDRVIGLWGYRQDKRLFTNSKEAVRYVAERSKTDRCLIGPVDMGRLGYLLFSNLYSNMDHYITVYQIDGQMFCVDSEGIPARKVSEEEMHFWFQSNKLPEARGYIAVRTFERIEWRSGEYREKNAMRNSVALILRNMREAQGDLAIKQCFQWLLDNPTDRWKLSFLYDINYLIQRKYLQIYWTEYAEYFSILKKDVVCMIRETVQEQIKLLQKMFRLLRREEQMNELHFENLAELEKQIETLLTCRNI